MKLKALKGWYWTFTIIICLFMFGDGISSLFRSQSGIDLFASLGYPSYLLIITGVAKVLGALAVIQNKYPDLKQWGYAGFAIDFIGAAASFAFSHFGFGDVVFPLIFLVFTLLSYYFWKRLVAARAVIAS